MNGIWFLFQTAAFNAIWSPIIWSFSLLLLIDLWMCQQTWRLVRLFGRKKCFVQCSSNYKTKLTSALEKKMVANFIQFICIKVPVMHNFVKKLYVHSLFYCIDYCFMLFWLNNLIKFVWVFFLVKRFMSLYQSSV